MATYSIIEVRRGTGGSGERTTIDSAVFNADPVAGDTLLVAVACWVTDGSPVTHNAPTDLAGNTYIQVGTTIVQGQNSISLWVCLSANGSTSSGNFYVTSSNSIPAYRTVVAWLIRASEPIAITGDFVAATGVTDLNGLNPLSTPAPSSSAFFLTVATRPAYAASGLGEGAGWNTPDVDGLTTGWHNQALYQDQTSNVSLCTAYKISGTAELASWVDLVSTSAVRGVLVASFSPGGGDGGDDGGDDPPPPPPPLNVRIQRENLQIRNALSPAPSTAAFVVEGEHPPPVGTRVRLALAATTLTLAAEIAGENAARGVMAGARLLFEGVVQTREQDYEGLRTHLAWHCTAIDHVYELNKRRPFGVFTAQTGDLIITKIMETYAPAFDLSFVQEIEVPITIAFNGERSMSDCLTAIADALGSCHWYLDGFALHFYHVGVNIGTSSRPAAPSALTPPSAGTAGSTFLDGWSLFAMSFVYPDGIESDVSDAILVNLVAGHTYDFASLPIGGAYFGAACVRRYLYQFVFRYLGNVDWVLVSRRWVHIIPDNTSTTCHLTLLESDPLVTVPRTPPTRASDTPAPTTALAFTFRGTGGSGAAEYWYLAVTFVYETGLESALGPVSTGVLFVAGSAYVDLTAIPVGAPNADGKAVIARVVYIAFASVGTGPVGDWRGIHVIDNNSDTTWTIEIAGGTTGFLNGGPSSGGSLTPHEAYIRDQPRGSTAPPSWGTSLEDALEQPDALTDDSPTLIHDNPPLRSTLDDTQIRTRVIVVGASTPLTDDTEVDDTVLTLDTTLFDLSGGNVLIAGVRLAYARINAGTLVLVDGATVPIAWPAGTLVALVVQRDDLAAQADLGAREAVDGVPTDGVRESTITDTSITTAAQAVLRGDAELALWSRPIVTVTYGTFDVKTRPGRLVAIDLTDPPLVHPGLLIQDVTIDHVEASSGAPLAPRYTVTASSVRFTLDDVLRRVPLS